MRVTNWLVAASALCLTLPLGCGDSGPGTDPDAGTDSDSGPAPSSGVVSAISLFQVIDIPLLDSAGEVLAVEARNAPVVADRRARLVVYLEKPASWPSSSAVEVRVEVTHGGETTTYRSSLVLEESSVVGDPSTAAQIDLPAVAVQSDSSCSVSVWLDGESAPSARIPETGAVNLGAEEMGAIKIHLVPYVVDGFTPDTSSAIVEGFRDAVLAVYPTSEVEISVGAARPFATNDVGSVLIDVGAVQEADGAPADVYYYAMVSGVADRDAFTGSTGTSENGGESPERAYFAAGAAFGDDLSESTLVHELGHLHQLEHSPCGEPPDIDPSFPDPEGSTGVLGFDSRTNEFVAADTSDLMGYCQPRWIGEYHYVRLFEHVQLSQTW